MQHLTEDQPTDIYEQVALQDIARVDTYMTAQDIKIMKNNVVDSVENIDTEVLDQEFERNMYENLQDAERNISEIGDKASDISLSDKGNRFKDTSIQAGYKVCNTIRRRRCDSKSAKGHSEYILTTWYTHSQAISRFCKATDNIIR